MPTSADTGLSAFGKLLLRVGACGFEQPVARRGTRRVSDHQRARHKLRKHVNDGVLVYRVIGGHCRRRRYSKATREDRQPPQHHALVFRKQVIAPVERRAQRLLTRQRGTRSAREQSEAITQTSIDLLDRQGAGARGSEFQRQRNAIKVST